MVKTNLLKRQMLLVHIGTQRHENCYTYMYIATRVLAYKSNKVYCLLLFVCLFVLIEQVLSSG